MSVTSRAGTCQWRTCSTTRRGASLLRVHPRRASVPVDTAQLAGTEVPRLRTIATERLLGQAQRDVAR